MSNIKQYFKYHCDSNVNDILEYKIQKFFHYAQIIELY